LVAVFSFNFRNKRIEGWYLVLAHLIFTLHRPEDSEGTFSVFESNCQLFLPANHSKIQAIPLSALPKDITGGPRLVLHSIFFKLNVKQLREAVNKNCFSLFCLPRRENRTKKKGQEKATFKTSQTAEISIYV